MPSSNWASRCYAFDLDGVLMDTQTAVREAYAAAGVVMDPSFWGLPWEDWLPRSCNGDKHKAQEVHDAKNNLYAQSLRDHGKPLTGAQAFRIAEQSGARVYVITAASRRAARMVLGRLGLEPSGLVASTPQRERGKHLQRWDSVGIYVDDQPHYVDAPGWTVRIYDSMMTPMEVLEWML
jgi:phosphoglycolate phosphatase-like HAD superfamily hydrolase